MLKLECLQQLTKSLNTDDDDWMSTGTTGNVFQTMEAATGNERRCMVLRRLSEPGLSKLEITSLKDELLKLGQDYKL